jgi:hypothetical protein
MTEVRGETPQKRGSMGLLDVIALVLSTLGLAALWALQLFVVPAFVRMFADFGPDGTTPSFTAWVARPMLVTAVSLVVLVALGAGLGLRLAGRSTLGGVALGAAALVAWLAVPGLIVAIYEPIWAMR